MLKVKRKIAYLCVWLFSILLCACAGDADGVILIGSEESVITTDSMKDCGGITTEIAEGEISAPFEKNRRAMTEEVNETFGNVLSENSDMPGTICVYVCGAVVSPGVVELTGGSRVKDALEAAGGFEENASRTYVNLADWVQDGQMIYFPREEEVTSGQISIYPEQLQTSVMQSPTDEEQGVVNINTADVTLLCTLPGIGERRAADIIAYRQANGFFQSCEDIMSVPGIKTGVYEKICDRITVD